MDKRSTKKKVTLFLDTETLRRLEAVAEDTMAGSNKSQAVRFLAKEYEKQHKKED